MAKIPPHIEELAKRHSIPNTEFWNCHGTWVCKHRALEDAAARAGVKWAAPQVIESDSAKAVSMIATGTLGDLTEWSVGEASPKNNKNAYPWAMAEKRAKDRVILKLLGFAGQVYSEEEADDFKASKPKDKPLPRGEVSFPDQAQTNRELKAQMADLTDGVKAIDGMIDWSEWGLENADRIKALPEDCRDQIRTAYEARKMDLEARVAA